MSGVSIKNFTRRPTAPRAVFNSIATEVLPAWDISLVFVGATRARALNYQLRNKEYVPNVLSYALGDKNCEIIICPSEAEKQAPTYGLEPRAYCLLLFIHGVLHIKGWAHGGRMEACEQKLLTRYVTTHSNRHRYRHVPSQDGRRRRTQ